MINIITILVNIAIFVVGFVVNKSIYKSNKQKDFLVSEAISLRKEYSDYFALIANNDFTKDANYAYQLKALNTKVDYFIILLSKTIKIEAQKETLLSNYSLFKLLSDLENIQLANKTAKNRRIEKYQKSYNEWFLELICNIIKK